MKKSRLARLRRTAVRRFARWADAPLTETTPGVFETCEGDATDEGWARSWAVLDTRTTPFTFEHGTEGADCDGRVSSYCAGVYAPRMRCGMNRPAGRERTPWGGYRERWVPIRERGRFVVEDRGQRDYRAELAGY